jgi:hypothetical protein
MAVAGEARRIHRKMRGLRREPREGHRLLTVLRIVSVVVIVGLLIADVEWGESRTLLHVAVGCSIGFAAMLMVYMVVATRGT